MGGLVQLTKDEWAAWTGGKPKSDWTALDPTAALDHTSPKVKIKARLPSQYPGENLEAMAADLRKDARELVAAGQYDHNLTMSMLKNFLLAGGPGNEDFRHPLRDLKLRLSQALLDIGYKDKAAANKYMVEHKLTFKDICEQAKSTYGTM